MYAVEISVGLIGLILGGEILVRGAVAFARRIRVSPLIIGLTLVGFGTSMPEMVTSIEAALSGSPGIAIGNVVGSNIANILLILGLAALVSPISVTAHAFWRDGSVLSLVTLASVLVLGLGHISWTTGFISVLVLVVYIAATVVLERRHASAAGTVYTTEGDGLVAPQASPAVSIAMVLGGLAVTIVAAGQLVSGAVELASMLGVSDAVIGLTIVAVGTSLPELVTSIVAAYRGQNDVAFGNIVGSNLFNLLGILGVTAVIHPLEVPPSIVAFDVWVMVAATAMLVAVSVTSWRIHRIEGAAMIVAYAAYISWLIVKA